MRKFAIIFLVFCVVCPAFAESYLYAEAAKNINGGWTYSLPKLELNKTRSAGMFLGQPCSYLQELELALVYTAPRSAAARLNHSSVDVDWHVGLELQPFWATCSIGGSAWIAGNDAGVPPGFEGRNTLRVGMAWD